MTPLRNSFLLLSLLPLFLLSSCAIVDDSITDFTFRLPEKEFSVDTAQFGMDLSAHEEIPSVACPGSPACSELGTDFSCGTSGTCEATITYDLKSDIIRLSEEVEEFAVVTSQDHVNVSFKYIQMEVMVNTLNFDLPPMELYIAPQSVTTLFDGNGNLSAGVILLGTLDEIPAGTTDIMDINLSPNGQQTLTEFVSRPDVPFYLFVAGSTTFSGGDPIPTGRLDVRVHSAATASIN